MKVQAHQRSYGTGFPSAKIEERQGDRMRRLPPIETDRLLEEVSTANRRIGSPAERTRVIPSRPC